MGKPLALSTSSGLVCGLLLGLVSGPAAAVTVSCGPDVCYQYDETQPALDFFGAPSVVGNDLVFTPGNPNPFRARSVDGTGVADPGVAVTGGGTATNQQTLVIDRVYSLNGALDILSITAFEQGDYEIEQDGSVSADLYLQAVSLVNALDNDVATDAVNASGDSGGLQLWQMSGMVNPAAEFTQAANDLRLTVQNTLSAFTDANGERAAIEKKLVLTVTTVIPVPAAVWLFASALGLLGWIRTRAV